MVSTFLFNQLSSILGIKNKLPDGEYSISTDSRQYSSGEIFVALNGENFKGIDFIPAVLEKGCELIVYNQDEEEKINLLADGHPSVCWVKVKDTIIFLQELARSQVINWVKRTNGQVIGITGSNGKTTNKDMLFHFLNSLFPGKVWATQKNFNNHIGVPKTLFALRPEHQIAIVEMGSNHPGEMEPLCEAAMPHAGIITNIGDSHLEFFNNREGVFNEKRVLFDQVMKNTSGKGLFIINSDDIFLQQLPRNEGVLTFSASMIDSGSVRVMVLPSINRPRKFEMQPQYDLQNEYILGEHNFTNLGATFLLACALFPDKKDELLAAARSFRPTANRSCWVEDKNKKRYFLDAYNANPSSMRSALTSMIEYLKGHNISIDRQFYLLGDMNELGESAASLHMEVGRLVYTLGIRSVAFIGRYSDFYYQGYLQGQKEHGGKAVKQDNSSNNSVIVCDSKDVFVNNFWAKMRKNFDYFFIKGSRGAKLESLLESD